MMRVALMNLGDAPRVFYNKINRAVLVPVGRVVMADLSEQEVKNLRFPARPETVLVCDPDTPIPDEMQAIVELLNIIDFEDPAVIRQQFQKIAPPSSMTQLNLSRMQMRVVLRTMVEDYIQAQAGKPQIIRDDVDPAELQRELDDQQPEPHPLAQEKQQRAEREILEPAQPAPARSAPAHAGKKAKGRRR